MAAPEPQRGIDTQQPPGRGFGHPQQLLHVVDVAQDAPGMLQVQLTLGGEAHAARGAVHQRHAHARLHQGQVFADSRGGDAQLACGSAQAARTS